MANSKPADQVVVGLISLWVKNQNKILEIKHDSQIIPPYTEAEGKGSWKVTVTGLILASAPTEC